MGLVSSGHLILNGSAAEGTANRSINREVRGGLTSTALFHTGATSTCGLAVPDTVVTNTTPTAFSDFYGFIQQSLPPNPSNTLLYNTLSDTWLSRGLEGTPSGDTDGYRFWVSIDGGAWEQQTYVAGTTSADWNPVVGCVVGRTVQTRVRAENAYGDSSYSSSPIRTIPVGACE